MTAGVGVAFVALVMVGFVTYGMTSRQVENTRWVEHTHTVLETIATLAEHLVEVQSAERGYLLTGAPEGLAARDAAVRGVLQAEAQLRALTRDNARQQERLIHVEQRIAALLADAATRRAAPGKLPPAPHALASTRGSDEAIAAVQQIAVALLAEERRLLALRDEVMAAGVARTRIMQTTGVTIGLVLLTFSFVVLRREIRSSVAAGVALRASEAVTRQLNDELELRVRTRTAQLEASNRELESFSYSVAHDFRTPLRGLSGFAEILLDDYKDKLDAEGVDALHEIHDNSRKLAILIDALLSLSRVTRSEVKPGAVNLSALVRSVAGELQAAEARRNVQLIVADNVEAELDPLLARTLIESLIGNAWKFTAKTATPRIEFGSKHTDGQPTFFVRDNGAGFDMAHAMKLFVPFHRLHTIAEFPGTGIGLSTAQRIVARFGGRIWADGQVDQGATFYFTLSETLQGASSS